MTDETHLNDLVNNCLSYVDKNGTILSKNSTGVSSSLEMEYQKDDMYFHFSVYSHCQGNGSCKLEIKRGEEVVLDASGGFTAKANDMRAKIYQRGEWEKTIPDWKRR